MLNGRGPPRPPPREVGRLCHERVELRPGDVDAPLIFDSSISVSASAESWFSLAEDEEKEIFEASGSGVADGSRLLSESVAVGSSLIPSVRRAPWRLDRGDGVFAGEDFWGEMDLARSRKCVLCQYDGTLEQWRV